MINKLVSRIRKREAVPIIGNSVCVDRIFAHARKVHPTFGAELGAGPGATASELLTMKWASTQDPNYPFSDKDNLARVAQHSLVFRHPVIDEAKEAYLTFLKEQLLKCARRDAPEIQQLVEEDLWPGRYEKSFSNIVQELGYPHFADDDEDSLYLLARLHLPIYVTTSYYDFIEHAIRKEGRTPRTHVCSWRAISTSIQEEHRPPRDYVPTPEDPVVYHLFGHERYPATMVLAEDDYVDLMIAVSQPPPQGNPTLPLYLTGALASSMLLLLGYRLQDWDFRTLFRGIIHSKRTQLGLPSLAIQLRPSPELGAEQAEMAVKYLEKFFDRDRFSVKWEAPDSFVRKLSQEYHRGQRGEP